MGSLLVVTGPPGAGKSTVAAAIADQLEPSALIAGDAFFAFLRRGSIVPWLPEAHQQNTTVTRAAGAAVGQCVDGGIEVVYDGVVGPWFLDEFLASTALASLAYVILLPPIETCVDRVATRVGHGFTEEAAARHMHDRFTRADIHPRHIISDAERTVGELAESIVGSMRSGSLTYGTP